MASPSKEGLRCGWGMISECSGLVLERDPRQGLGVRCYKKNCRQFHPLEVLLSRAVEQGLLSSEQSEAARRAVSEEKINSSRQREGTMNQCTRTSKTQALQSLVELGKSSKNPYIRQASEYVENLKLDLDEIERIAGIEFEVAQFQMVTCTLGTRRLEGLKAKVAIHPFNTSKLANFYLTVNTYMPCDNGERLDLSLFSCTGRLNSVWTNKDSGQVRFDVESLIGTDYYIELFQDPANHNIKSITVSVVGKDKNPRLLSAQFCLDQIYNIPETTF